MNSHELLDAHAVIAWDIDGTLVDNMPFLVNCGCERYGIAYVDAKAPRFAAAL